MSPLFTRIVAAKRKRLFGEKLVFEKYRALSDSDITNIEWRIGCQLPASLRKWLLQAGYGDLNDELSFREEWFNAIAHGLLKDHVCFAQDILGNFYSFSSINGEIHYICRSEPEYAFIANEFAAFLEQLEKRSFELVEWIDDFRVLPYH